MRLLLSMRICCGNSVSAKNMGHIVSREDLNGVIPSVLTMHQGSRGNRFVRLYPLPVCTSYKRPPLSLAESLTLSQFPVYMVEKFVDNVYQRLFYTHVSGSSPTRAVAVKDQTFTQTYMIHYIVAQP